MLGKEHLLLSTGTVLPFLIPLVFLEDTFPLGLFISFYLAVMIGSLTPDADCRGKPKLFYDFPYVYILMKPIEFITRKFFSFKEIKVKLKVQKEIKEEHRGIMHSPIGTFVSSLLLTIILGTLLIILEMFHVLFILIIFWGLWLGQLLHLVQDSCTKTGIDWKFPFGEKLAKGKILTGNKKDNRPKIFAIVLNSLLVGLIALYAMGRMKVQLWIVYVLLITLISLLWVLFFRISQR